MNPPSIISGQQIGLLGGPLFVLVKIMGVIKTAQEKKLRPIFWLETNDADFNEVKTSYFIDQKKKLRSFTWEINSAGKPLGHLLVDNVLLKGIDFFLQNISVTPHTKKLKEYLFNSYQLKKTLAEATRILYQQIFKNYPIEFFDPQQNKEFIRFSQGYLLQEAEKTLGGEQVAAFVLKAGRREAIFKKQDGFVLRSGEPVLLQKHTLLPHLYTRSVIQDAFLNSEYYLAGESENAYLLSAKMQEQYRYHDVTPAKVLPRAQIEIIEKKDKDFLLQEHLDTYAIFRTPFYQLKRKVLQERENFDKKKVVNNLNQLKKDYIQELKKLNLPYKKIEKKIYSANKHVGGTKRKELTEKNKTILSNLEKLSKKYFPHNQPASRILSFAYYYNQFGEELLEKVYQVYQNDQEIILEI